MFKHIIALTSTLLLSSTSKASTQTAAGEEMLNFEIYESV